MVRISYRGMQSVLQACDDFVASMIGCQALTTFSLIVRYNAVGTGTQMPAIRMDIDVPLEDSVRLSWARQCEQRPSRESVEESQDRKFLGHRSGCSKNARCRQ